MGKPEAHVEKYLVKRVEELGGFIRKLEWVGRNSAPDRLVALKGHIVFVETKAKDGKLKAAQTREINRMREHLIPTVVANTRELVDDMVSHITNNPKGEPCRKSSYSLKTSRPNSLE
ncbi:MAG: hypothetical protein V3U75_13525 [Methylococcaceae bacterium]